MYPFDTFLLTIILQGMIVSQKYCATSMLIKEIPIDVKKIIGGVIDCKNINFLIDGLVSLWIEPVLTADNQIKVSIEPVKTKIIS